MIKLLCSCSILQTMISSVERVYLKFNFKYGKRLFKIVILNIEEICKYRKDL